MGYIYFELNDRKLKINPNDSEDIYIWFDTHVGRKIDKPYWKPLKLKKDLYYRVCVGNQKYYLLHRVVYYANNQDWDIDLEPRKNQIDHIDRDKFNNNIGNLRPANMEQNCQNRSNVKGYHWNPAQKRFRVMIGFNSNPQKYIGSFVKEEDARQAYLKAKELYHEW